METYQTTDKMNYKELVSLLEKQTQSLGEEKSAVLTSWQKHFSMLDKFNNKNIAVIGCGGVGIRIATLVTQLLTYSKGVELHLYDGDLFEERNADRQLVNCNGKYKANALKEHIDATNTNVEVLSLPMFFPLSFPLPTKYDVIFLAADKKLPKRTVFDNPDYLKPNGLIVMAGNEYDYYQSTAFLDGQTAYDVYPDLKEPERESVAACTGEITISEPQLVLFNQLAATTAVQLWWQYVVNDNVIYKTCYEGNFFTNNTFER